MVNVVFWMVVFVAFLYVLIKSSDLFTSSAEKVGLYFGMPNFLIGVVIISLGTSIPELTTSLVSVFKGSSEIVMGNVIGSNITNVFLVLGLSALLARGIDIKGVYHKFDKPLFFLSALLLLLFSLDGSISFWEAGILLLGYIVYIFRVIHDQQKEKHERVGTLSFKTISLLVASSIAIYFSANFVVMSLINISEMLNVGKDVAAAAAVGLGTSLPELSVSINAIRKGKYDLVVGNVLGSNIFNILVVAGISGLFTPLIVTSTMLLTGMSFMMLASVMFLFMSRDKRFSQYEGLVLLGMYVLFLVVLF